MVDDGKHAGAMIALVPSDNDLDRLTLAGGEPREDIHLTLWFLGEGDAFDVETREALVNAVSGTVERREPAPMRVRAFGVNYWNPDSDDPAWVLAIGDLPENERKHESLDTFRGVIEEVWHDEMVKFDLPVQHSPWSPHITIAYGADVSLVNILEERLGDVILDRVRIAFNGEITDVPLASPRDTMLTSVGGVVVPWSKVRNHAGCSSNESWAVVKDETDEVEGCHSSEEAADRQLAVLNASESESVGEIVGDENDDACVDRGYDVDHFGPTSSSVSNAPWDGSASRFSDEQYRMSTAGCDSGEGTVKERCFLPHHEPGGATSRRGVFAAAARFNQVQASSEAKARAKAHLRAHYGQLDEELPDILKATVEEIKTLARSNDDCPPGQRRMPDGECIPDGEMNVNFDVTEDAAWEGVLAVEGTLTGDGREFAVGSLTWAELPIPLRWNIEDSHGGIPQTRAVLVGRIDVIERDGDMIQGSGVFDLGRKEGREAHRLVKDKFLKGVSIDVDDVADADVELVFPEGTDENEILMPEKTLFHAGRIRAATLVDVPAFVEAFINLVSEDDAENESDANGDDVDVDVDVDEDDADAVAASGVTSLHATTTTDEPWAVDTNQSRLPTLMSSRVARGAYAWIDVAAVKDGRITKNSGRFLHHMVNDDGTVGPANLTACSGGIGVLNSGRAFADMSTDEKQSVYAHLAKHLRDAGKTPPPARFADEVARVAAIVVDDRPSREWFKNPELSVPTPITVTDVGRVYGHAAEWDACHIGFPDVCVTPPAEDYHPYYMTGEVACADGSRVAVGQVTVGTGHAPLSYGASRAADHYDNTGTAVADVVVGNDVHGIWVAGAVRPNADVARIRDLRGSGQVSGDWRRIGGQLRLVGLLAVNVPGYPVPRLSTRVASGEPHALIAAGRTSVGRPYETDEQRARRVMREYADTIARRIGRERKITTTASTLVASATIVKGVG